MTERPTVRFRVSTSEGRTFYTEARTARGARNRVSLSIDQHGTGDEKIVSATAFCDGIGRSGVWTLEDV